MTDDPVSPPDPTLRAHPTPPPLDRLFAEAGAPVRRVVFGRGVELRLTAGGAWELPSPFPGPTDPALAALRALGLAPGGWGGWPGPGAADPSGAGDAHDPAALAARHGLRPILLATPGGPAGDVVHVVSAAGTLAWRPPLDRVADDPALALPARRLRFAVDALEHHLARAAECYADAARAARRAALLFGTWELTALAGHTAAYIELDATLAAALRIYRETAALVWEAFGPTARAATSTAPPPRRFDETLIRARTLPGELRETLLDSWTAQGAPARAARRLLTDAAAELAHAPVRVTPLEPDVWAASIPLPDPCVAAAFAARRRGRAVPPRPRVDALDHAWGAATEALRAATLAVYGVADAA